MIKKCVKFKILKPYEKDMSWSELNKLLSDICYKVSIISNLYSQHRYMMDNNDDYKRLFEADSKHYNKNNKLDKENYNELKVKYPELPGAMVNQIIRAVKGNISALKDKLRRKETVYPSYKKDTPILVNNPDYKVLYDTTEKCWHLDVQLASTANGNKKTRYDLIFESNYKNKSGEAVLQGVINGKYKKGQLKILKQKSKWYVIIAYDKELAEEDYYDLNPDKIMGIDLGIVNAAYYAFNDSLQRGYIRGGEIEAFRIKTRKQRQRLQKMYSFAGDGRHGHGVHRALQATEALSEKEKNFKNLTNHRYAKKLVSIALKNHCKTIQMEDLSGISAKSTFLKNWPYYDLKQKIKDKALEYGITVIDVEPKYTSQRCSCCGYIEQENRPTQSQFECVSCGYKTNADYNAAKNIATKDIDKIIKESIIN